ncbi:MAG: DUF6029 family protein [bacterium]
MRASSGQLNFGRPRDLLLLVIALAAAAPAADLTITGVNRAEFWSYLDSSYTTQLEEMLDLNLRYGDLRGTFGLFAFEPAKPWTDVPPRRPVRFLDYSIAYSPRQLEILYGRFYQDFGKGLALRSYRDDEFRHYKSLHGLRGIARLPLRTELVLLGARLREVFFQDNSYIMLNVADTTDQALGANLSSRPFRWGGFGGRYVRINRDRDPEPRAFTELFGGDLTATAGPVEVYGEVCQRLGTAPGLGGREKGFGWYASGTATFPGFSLLGQAMDYDALGFPAGLYHWNDPPTPIKSGVALNRGEDERGFGLLATATPWSPLYLEAEYGRLYTHDDTSAGVVEWEGKARYPVSDWSFELAFNRMLQHNVELGTRERVIEKPVIHVNYLTGQHSFALEGECGFVSELSTEGESWEYRELAGALSWGYGPALLFTVGYQYVDVKLDKRYNGEQHWPVVEAVWSVTQRNMLRVRVGAERGGYTCSGGICRMESPFRGVKVQLVTRF